uniref:Copia protein n=1 Tax=Talaromyces marneffei PM1 TaxID=1077442 RepID=A0A093V6S6_TALMA
MLSKQISKPATEQTLTGPNDWERWEKIFLSKIEQKDLMGYLTGERELPTRPEMTVIPPTPPSIEALRERNRTTNRDRERSTQTEGDQASQDEAISTGPATSAEKAALKLWKDEYSLELSHFNTLMTYYRTQESRYEAERKKIDDIIQWMQTSEFQTWPKDINSWVTQWMSIMQRGKQYNLTFAKDVVNWTKDFFDAFYKADPAWVTVLRTTYSDRIEAGNITYNDFAKQVQEQDRTRPKVTAKRGFQRGAFNANQQQDGASDEDNNNENENNTRSESYRGKATEVVIEEENEATRTINQLAQAAVLLVSDAKYRKARPGDYLLAGNSKSLWKMGYYWDQRQHTTAYAETTADSWANSPRKGAWYSVSAHKESNSWTPRPPRKADIQRWHLRLGHPGPQALEHLSSASRGVRVTGISPKSNLTKGEGIKTVECDACATAKMKRQIRREPREKPSKPGERLAIDFHDFESSTSGYSSTMLVTDRYSGYIWDYNLTDRTGETIRAALADLLPKLDAQYGLVPWVIECDNEIYMNRPLVKEYLESFFIRLEPSPPYTQALNGAAERSGGVIKDKGRSMAASGKIPHDLWPEINRAAVYLFNRTPRYESNWKTPYEVFHTYLALQNGKVFEDMKPNQAHLRVYGCKAYSLTTKYMKKEKRLQRYHPKAWIGYLVGYDSTNIFRIWNPKLGVVVSARDVIFNEDEVFDGNLDKLRNDLATTTIDEIAELLNSVHIQNDKLQSATVGGPSWTQEDEPNSYNNEESLEPRKRTPGAPSAADIDAEVPFQDRAPESGQSLSHAPATGLSQNEAPATGQSVYRAPESGQSLSPAPATGQSTNLAPESGQSLEKDIIYPTPPDSPPAVLMSATIQNPVKDELNRINYLDSGCREAVAWEAAFTAGTSHKIYGSLNGKPFNRSSLRRALRSTTGLQSFFMPPTHQIWSKVPYSYAKGRQVLDCMWVYVYKFDKHGRLLKCKARLVVRGDQQVGLNQGDTYAATLAARSFRTFMAIAARFDLEMAQYDAVNAFVHAPIQETVFMRIPPGYRHLYPGTILKLNKALYGLRTSPLQWQRTLTESLQKLGFKSVPHEPCCMIKSGILIFFYVDDIVLAYKKDKEKEARSLMNNLKKEYTITGGEELQWFLGIRVIRDREKKLIWLSQASYIDKIAKLADTFPIHDTPMAKDELLPYTGRASHATIHSYQRKVGSLMYAAVSTRLDIAFAVSRLSRFLTNPSPTHHRAADRVLLYLQSYRHLALQLGGGDGFVVASDASFADNTLDRKSSQAYVMTLYGGITGWQANKQNTVTTSTTEAELLALSQAAKEGMYVMHLLKELDVKLETPRLHLECDNKQTISLIEKDIVTLKTKLRHVDIHHHWLREQFQEGRVELTYVPTKKMIANGLTKALPKGEFDAFLEQIKMTDISRYLHEQKEDTQEVDMGTVLNCLQI